MAGILQGEMAVEQGTAEFVTNPGLARPIYLTETSGSTNLAIAVCALLAEAGLVVEPGTLDVVRRQDRWMAKLPDGRLAWFPANEAGTALLAREGRVLDLLAARCIKRHQKPSHWRH